MAFFKFKLWIAVPLWLFLNSCFALWLYWHVLSGSNPSPRNAINKSHSGWQGFSVMLHVFGFSLGMINTAMWFRYRDAVMPWFQSRSKSIVVSIPGCQGKAGKPNVVDSKRLRMLVLLSHFLVIVPLAIVMSMAPLLSPFVILRLAQKHAWLHRCDSYPGEILLEGRPFDAISQSRPLASFYFFSQNGDRVRTKLFEYYILYHNDSNIWSLNLQLVPEVQIPSRFYPLLSQVSYNDPTHRTFTATCITGPDTPVNETTPCMEGQYRDTEYLYFLVNETRTHTITELLDYDKEWAYNDNSDAPSYLLHRLEADGSKGAIEMRTAVTRGDACTKLKVCAQEFRADVPSIGVTLKAQDSFALRCSKPTVG